MAKYSFKGGSEPLPEQEAPAENTETASVPPIGDPDTPTPATVEPGTYIGPNYKYGIVIPDTTQQVDPRRMSAEERADLIGRYPPAAEWFA